jgi:hypothetical protein
MEENKINFHLGIKGSGHFYEEFVGEIPKGIDLKSESEGKDPQRFFGKNPEIKNMPAWAGDIKDER